MSQWKKDKIQLNSVKTNTLHIHIHKYSKTVVLKKFKGYNPQSTKNKNEWFGYPIENCEDHFVEKHCS